MRNLFGTIYWIVVGVLTIVGIFASVAYGLPFYFLLIVLAMALIGAWRPGLRYSWAALFGLLTFPVIMLSTSLLEQVVQADWSCSEVSFQPGGTVVEYGGPSGEEVVCATIPGQLIIASVILWAIALFLIVALLYLLLRVRADAPEPHPDTVAERGEPAINWTSVDLVGLFVRATAVLMGLANMLVIGDPRDVFASSEGWSLAVLSGNLLLATVAGLAASEIILVLGRPALSGGFLARYGITVLGVCLGGAILGGSSILLGLLTNQPGAQDDILGLVYAALAYGLIAAMVGGVLGALEGLILAFPLAATLGKLRRPSQGQRRGFSLPSVALLCLLIVVTIASYAAMPTPEAETARLSDNPPLSCPKYLEEKVATFYGPGDQTTPVFETSGDEWGYQTSSVGRGSLKVRVLDEDGNDVQGSDEPLPEDESLPGNSVSMAEFAFSGTFSLEIAADDSLEYEVLVCD